MNRVSTTIGRWGTLSGVGAGLLAALKELNTYVVLKLDGAVGRFFVDPENNTHLWDAATDMFGVFMAVGFGVGAVVGTARDRPAPWQGDKPVAEKVNVPVTIAQPAPITPTPAIVTPIHQPAKNYFSEAELDCKCNDLAGCDYQGMHPTVLEIANDLREQFGPLYVTSAYRCDTHNQNVGGVDNSYHRRGMAMDLKSNTVMPETLFNYLTARYPNRYGFGLYEKFVHVDCRQKTYARKLHPSDTWREYELDAVAA